MSDVQTNTFWESILKYWPIILLAITLAGGAFTSTGALAVILYKFNQSETEKKELKAENNKQYNEILNKLDTIKENVNLGKSDISNIKNEMGYIRERMAKLETSVEKLQK